MTAPRACTRTRKAPKPRLPLFTGKVVTLDQIPARKELALHFSVAKFIDGYLHADWRATHFPAGEKRDEITGKKLKRMGLKKGWLDWQLVAPTGMFHALELKAVGGSLSDEQEEFIWWCRKNGIPHAVVDTFKDAVTTLNDWGCLRIKFAEVR